MTDKVIGVKVYAFAELKQNIWFIPREYNALCRYNKRKKNIDYMTLVPNEEQMPTLYSKVVVYERYLILVPYMASEVAVFDTEKMQFEKLKLPEPDRCYKYREIAKFYGGVRIGKQIYLIPGEFPEIVCINMENRKVEAVNAWYPLYGKTSFSEEKMSGPYKGIDKFFCLNGNTLYITFFACETGKLGKFSFDTHEMEIYTVPGTDSYFSCMEIYGDDLYLVTRSGQIFCWNTQSKKVIDKYFYEPEVDGIKRDEILYEIFGNSILYDNKLYLFWSDKPQYTEINLNNHNTKTFFFQNINNAIFDMYFSQEGKYLFTNESNLFYQIKDGKIEKNPFIISYGLLEKYFFEGYFQKNIYFRESDFFGLRKMLPILSDIRSEKDKVHNNVGKEIFCL